MQVSIAKLRNEQTISGEPDSVYTGYLYVKRLIIRERIPASDGGAEQHIVYCFHCRHKFGPYDPKYTTTSAFGSHLRIKHPQLPSCEEGYKTIIQELMEESMVKATGKRKQSGTSPFTIARQNAGARAFGQTFEAKEYRCLLARMVVETNSSFRIVEAKAFHNLVRYCNSRVPIITRSTLHRDIQHLLYKQLFSKVRDQLQIHISEGARINLTLDAWTASNKVPFLAITAHWMTAEFELHSTLIGFERLRGSHTASNLAAVTMKVLTMYGISNHINCITSDNASVNDALFDNLEQELDTWCKEDGQICCLAHVLNLAAQTVMKTLKSEAAEAEVDLAKDSEKEGDIDPATTLQKLRKVIAKIRSSNLLWEALQTEAAAVKMDWLTPVLDVQVRWNSTHKMIHRAIELRPALDRLLMLDPTKIFHQAHLQLTETDWSTLFRLEQILDVFVKATTFASASTYPTLTQQLPYYQYIQNKLHELVQREHDAEDSSGDATSHFL